MRDRLRNPQGIVRLVGLSGVGKTRLVQALFDMRIGEDSLDPALAIYTDMNDSPDPQPMAMAWDLVGMRARAILIVDNCPPDLHERLTERCRTPDSATSLITVEYDVQDDQPEGTDVFRLCETSLDLVEKLTRRHYNNISQIDAHTIANVSGGNPRLAFALANTLEKNETLAGLSNRALFVRLFEQRQSPNQNLLRAAQACALVYSFDGETVTSEDAELRKLGAIVGMSAEEMFGHVVELKKRGLAQQRSKWRAILPHALANRLAAEALQYFPIATIEAGLDSERLLKSFSHRLGYLRDSREAVQLVERWLSVDGMLGELAGLNGVRKTMFANVAAVSPSATLDAIERAGKDPEGLRFAVDRFESIDVAQILRSLAFDEELFDRSVALLLTLGEIEARKGEKERRYISDIFEGLFQLYLSGTHAPVEQRTKVIDALLRSSDPVRQSFGLVGLRALLKAGHFHSSYGFDFGAWPRDVGYVPSTAEDLHKWYSSVISMLQPIAVSDLPIAEQVRIVLASQYRELWRSGRGQEALVRVTHAISKKLYWTVVESRMPLLDDPNLNSAHMAEFVNQKRKELVAFIERERRRETERDKDHDERFEC